MGAVRVKAVAEGGEGMLAASLGLDRARVEVECVVGQDEALNEGVERGGLDGERSGTCRSEEAYVSGVLERMKERRAESEPDGDGGRIAVRCRAG